MNSEVLSRRDVLKGLAHTAAMATFVPASALGGDGAPPPSERLCLGAIGVGAQGFPDMRYHENIRDYSLGMIACWGIHHLDIAQWGNGTEHTGPVSVKGTGTFPDSGTCDAILDWDVTFEFDGAAPVLFSDSKRRRHGLRFVGKDTWVFVRRGVIEAEDRAFLLDPQNKPGAMPIQLPVNPEEHTRDLIEAIRTGKPTVAGIDTALRSNTLCHLALAAVELGKTLRWDPVAEDFGQAAEDNKRLEPRPHRGAYQLPKTRGHIKTDSP